jgi:hypothetical protein
MEPYTILNSTKQALVNDGFLANFNRDPVPDHQFFVHPLPWRYEVGISGTCLSLSEQARTILTMIIGICRVYNNSALSDPSFKFNTTCTKKFHPPLDLLGLIAQDVPGGVSSKQYKNWEDLLTQAYPNIQSSSQMRLRSRLVVASSALVVLSVIWAISLIIATIVFKPLYPKWTIFLNVTDALMMIATSAMWSVVFSQVAGYSGDLKPEGVHTGPGFWVLWAIGFAKLAVTLMMMLISQVVVCALRCVGAH